jgi:hypothetical protein
MRLPEQAGRAAGTNALEIRSRNSRVAALQTRWDRLRAGLDLVLDQRGADMADLPGGASGVAGERVQGPTPTRICAHFASTLSFL